MAYDEPLANRIRQVFGARSDMVRIPDSEFDAVMRGRHVRPMDFTRKPLKRFVYVSPSGFRTATALRTWLSYGGRVADEGHETKIREPDKRKTPRATFSASRRRAAGSPSREFAALARPTYLSWPAWRKGR